MKNLIAFSHVEFGAMGVALEPQLRTILNRCREPKRKIHPSEYASVARLLMQSFSQKNETRIERKASLIIEQQLVAMELEDKLDKMSFFDLMRYVIRFTFAS